LKALKRYTGIALPLEGVMRKLGKVGVEFLALFPYKSHKSIMKRVKV